MTNNILSVAARQECSTEISWATPKKRTGKQLHILLVGFQDQDNLGLRYLMSASSHFGHQVEIASYTSDAGSLIDHVQKWHPDIIGFSLIFQYMAPDFARVITALRDAGVDAHLTIGGHYASFDSVEVLTRIPQLDSVVRYEGEATLVDLAEHLATGKDWRAIDGIAYRDPDGEIRSNSLRRPIEDLDELPLPNRDSIDYNLQNLATASLLGSRGCPWDCSFCSIRPFYEQQTLEHGGSLRRLRRPQAIVDEIEKLVKSRGVRVFLFQDDDFLATGTRARRWAEEIADRLDHAGLSGEIAFKISCRSDEIQHETLARLKTAGLCHVYMGVESGDRDALARMNKKLLPEAHLKAGQVLRELDISYDFGFMLLDPYSSFDEIYNNLDFLEAFVGDGWGVATFCRMLPYAGTPLKAKLLSEGRLLGSHFAPDYHFVEPRLDPFYDWMIETFRTRNFTNAGLCNILRSLVFEARLQLPSVAPVFTSSQRERTRELVAACNQVAIRTLRCAAEFAAETPLSELSPDTDRLRKLSTEEQTAERHLLLQVNELRRDIATNGFAGRAGGFDNSWTLPV